MADQGRDGGEAFDAAVVGGSFAGLSAALYLARGRRRVVVFDDGRTRNRFAPASHGFLGQDRRAPDAIRLAGRGEVLSYPTAAVRGARVTTVEGGIDAFRVVAEDGSVVTARRVVLAFGVRDVLPPVEGIAECWGITAVQCPYCHGVELADRPTGVLTEGPGAMGHARMLRDWTSELTLFTAGCPLSPEDRGRFLAQGARIEEAAVTALRHERGRVRAVRLADGREVALEVLYLSARTEPRTRLAEDLGCVMDEGPTGLHVRVDDEGWTTVPGVIAVGDVAKPTFGAAAAAADGVQAGVACHASLLGL